MEHIKFTSKIRNMFNFLMQAQSIRSNTKHHYNSQLVQGKMWCVRKNLFSTLLYIVKIFTLVSFIVKKSHKWKFVALMQTWTNLALIIGRARCKKDLVCLHITLKFVISFGSFIVRPIFNHLYNQSSIFNQYSFGWWQFWNPFCFDIF